MNGTLEGSVLVTALEDIGRQRARLEGEVDVALGEVAREEAVNRRAIEEGHRRMVALRAVRREQEERKRIIGNEIGDLEMAAVKEGLRRDAERFLERVRLVEEATVARDAQLELELAQPELAAAMGEFENYQDVEPTLGSMPVAIRKSVQEKHQRLVRKLEPFIRAANAGPPPIAAPPLGIAVVAAADPAEGPPEALVVVLPVPWGVYADWTERPEDLSTQLAYRVFAAMFRLLSALGVADAPVQYDEVHGNLAMQVWLGDHTVEGDLRERALEHIAGAYEEAAELWAAGVELYSIWVRPELLLADEGE